MPEPEPSTGEWAERYLQEVLGEPSEASAEHGPPPESSEFMDSLTDADLSYLHPDDRADHLETAVDALVDAVAGDGVAERTRRGRSASAHCGDDRVVVVMEGLGEVIDVDYSTAALVAFARGLDSRPVDA